MPRRRERAQRGAGGLTFVERGEDPPTPPPPARRPLVDAPRVLILGQAPGRSLAPALDPERTRTGAWLARVCGLDAEGFRSTFELANVLDYYPGTLGASGDRFPLRAAREAAAGLDLSRYERVVALGGVPVALGMRGAITWLVWREHRGTLVGPLPHPSGLNRWYNSPDNRAAATRFMREVVEIVQG